MAAQANAARGNDVLWLIGVKPLAPGGFGLSGASLSQFDGWLQSLLPFFDGLAPNVQAFTLPGEPTLGANRSIVALHIETSRVPFAVRANAKGTTLEVPWWDGHAAEIRSAGRADLIRLLVPLQDLPQFEVLDAELTFYKNLHANAASKIAHRWTLDGSLYVIPHPDTRAVIPLHRCRAGISIGDRGFSASANDFTLTADKQSPAVRITESAALIEGLGRMFVYCSGSTPATEIAWQSPLTLTFDLWPAGAERTAVVSARLRPEVATENNQAGRWKL